MMRQIALQPHFWILPIVALLLIAVGLCLLITGIRVRRAAKLRDRYTSRGEGRIFSGSLVGFFGGAVAVTWLVLLLPYSPEFWMLYRLSGEVQTVTRSFEEGTGELSNEPVVRIGGFSTPVVVADSRIYDYVGQDVDLTCSLEWVPYGQKRINCFIAGVAS